MKLLGLSLGFFLSVSTFAVGCAEAPQGVAATDENAIVDVPQTAVERQAIGNCWLYAHATWAESMHLSATGEAFDVSQSYWTYWHWFDQIAGSSADVIATGGNWYTANDIVTKYGLMAEADFVPADTTAEMSARQKRALDAINVSLATGVLSQPRMRSDKAVVRAELDRVWELSESVTASLTRVFGVDVSRTLSASANNAGTAILAARDFAVSYPTGPGRAAKKTSLLDAQREWRQVYYSSWESASFMPRVQKALHDAQPVIVTWLVDFNALENDATSARPGSFSMDKLNRMGPGQQGGHMVVLEDYQATLADGTVLRAGVTLDAAKDRDRALLAEALEPGTKIDFLRVKNSWGSSRPDRAFAPGMPGYHDLYLDYLDGPIKQCNQKDGKTDVTDCPYESTPLQNVVLPPGY